MNFKSGLVTSIFLSLAFLCCSVYASVLNNVTTVAGSKLAHNPEMYQSGMYVVLTGVGGGAFNIDHGGASAAVVVDGTVLQFDLGSGVLENLNRVGIYPEVISHLFFTHLHIDHTLNLPHFMSYIGWKNEPAEIFGPPGTKSIVSGAKTFFAAQAADLRAMGAEKLFNLDIEVNERNSGGLILETDTLSVSAIKTPHHEDKGLVSFAYRVESQYGSVVISGDTAPSMDIVDFSKGVDLLVHEAMHDETMAGVKFYKKGALPKLPIVKNMTAPTKGHTPVTEVGKVAQLSGAKKLVIYHHSFLGVEWLHRERISKQMKNGEFFYEAQMKYEAAHLIKKNYDGPVVIGEPRMVFEIKPSLNDYQLSAKD